MTIEHKLKKADPDSPNRCKGLSHKGQSQCPYLAEQGHDYCQRHLASHYTNVEKKNVRNYQLTKYQARVEDFADNSEVKSLREEIGITRLLLETIMNSCENSNKLIIHTPQISDLVMKIDKLVNSCHRLEQSTGLLLEKQAAMTLGDALVEIISTHIEDEDTIFQIAEDIINKIAGK